MNMLYSAEVRWFLLTKSFDSIEGADWFLAAKSDIGTPEAEDRVDRYLVLPDCDSVGVKVRGRSRFEIKAQISSPRPWRINADINGRMDQWVKWSYHGEELSKIEESLLRAGRWLTVKKKRHLRKFSVEGSLFVEVPSAQELTIGCDVEMTSIEVEEAEPGRRYWCSFGFEAFGPSLEPHKSYPKQVTNFFKYTSAIRDFPFLTVTR
jgi:hypothetical protein